jgi:hypothetical protein
MTLAAGHHHAALVPPLQLAQRNAGEPNHLAGRKSGIHTAPSSSTPQIQQRFSGPAIRGFPVFPPGRFAPAFFRNRAAANIETSAHKHFRLEMFETS